jgi:hypothetical protein
MRRVIPLLPISAFIPCSRTNCTFLLHLPGVAEKKPHDGQSRMGIPITLYYKHKYDGLPDAFQCMYAYLYFFRNHNGKVKWNGWPCRLKRTVAADSLRGGIAGSNPAGVWYVSIVRVVWCQVVVSATHRSLVQKRSTEDGVCVCVCMIF